MNNITKYNLKTCAISALGLILMFCVLSYVVAPQNDGFEFSSINPLGFIEGFLFTLGFGLGMPVWLSVVVLGVISAFIFMVFLWIVRKVIK
ncbi:hypothetical protein [Bacteroides fragilis]|uniref:hypothetical protein n=1 Tax=Bacteroides fragilis TaxID=817 RepID=UPI001E547255|nr:hypothetical protein [Bacteroides fragilis]